MSRRSAPLHVWLPVLALVVALALGSLWLRRHEGPTLLSETTALTAVVLFVWLFERT